MDQTNKGNLKMNKTLGVFGFESILLEQLATELEDLEGIRTFLEAGVMTQDAGLVIQMADGSEFQVTIVKSK